jgi:hypothetical protein
MVIGWIADCLAVFGRPRVDLSRYGNHWKTLTGLAAFTGAHKGN